MVRQCCCKLETFIKIVGILLSTTHFLLALSAVAWFVLNNVNKEEAEEGDVVLDSVIEVSDFSDNSDDYGDVGEVGAALDERVIILTAVLVTCFVGLVTNLLLLTGVKTEQRFLLLPWLIYHVLFILACLGGGLYLALHFTVLSDHEDYIKAVMALFPLVFGIFFIFIWIMVDQLFVNLRYKKHIEEVVASRRASLASINIHTLPHLRYNGDPVKIGHSQHIHNNGKYNNDTMRSNRSTRSCTKSVRSAQSVKTEKSLRQSRGGDKRNDIRGKGRSYQIQEFSCKLDLPRLV